MGCREKVYGLLVEILTFLIIALFIFSGLCLYSKINSEPDISSFDECLSSGNLILESFPRECRTNDGRLFTEQNPTTFLDFLEITPFLPNPKKTLREEVIYSTETQFLEEFSINDLEINFSLNDVIAIYLGEKSSGGYSVSVESIESTESSLTFFIRERSPGKNCPVTSALTYPVTIIEIEKIGKRVLKFVYLNEVRDC